MGTFVRGNRVEKVSGYRYPGIILECVAKIDGREVYLVEADHPDFVGMVHIFNEAQLAFRSDARQPIPQKPEDIEVGQKWEHNKRGDIYEVVNVSLDEPTLEWLVTYKHATHSELNWTRRVDVFLDRFSRVLLPKIKD